MIPETEQQLLLARLDASRQRLLAALEGVTERDFTAAVPAAATAEEATSESSDETVVQLLASLAQAEREAVAQVGGRATSPRNASKPMPPQVMHDLAGARYQTRRYVEDASADAVAAEQLVSGIEAREAAGAEQIRNRIPVPPPPEIPMAQRPSSNPG